MCAVIGYKLKQNASEGCNSCGSLAGLVFKVYCMFYFTCDRSFSAECGRKNLKIGEYLMTLLKYGRRRYICSLAEREKSLQNAINAMYRFDSDLKDYSLWLTKVDVVLSRYSEMTSDPASMDSTQRSQITNSLKVSVYSVLQPAVHFNAVK